MFSQQTDSLLLSFFPGQVRKNSQEKASLATLPGSDFLSRPVANSLLFSLLMHFFSEPHQINMAPESHRSPSADTAPPCPPTTPHNRNKRRRRPGLYGGHSWVSQRSSLSSFCSPGAPPTPTVLQRTMKKKKPGSATRPGRQPRINRQSSAPRASRKYTD